MARNSLGREIPEIWKGSRYEPYQDPWSRMPDVRPQHPAARAPQPLGQQAPGLAARGDREDAGSQSGMTIATHHHLRNGDLLLNLLVQECDAHGDPRPHASPRARSTRCNAEIIPQIRKGVVTRCETGVNGLIGELVSKGELDFPIVVRSHGGRARSIVAGEVPVDVAFIAAPCCDETGNLNGVQRTLGLRQPRLCLHRRPLRPQGRGGDRQPGAVPRRAGQHLPERRRLGGDDRLAGRPEEDRLHHHAHHPRPGGAPDRPLRLPR